MSKKTMITAKTLRALTCGGHNHRTGAIVKLEEKTFNALKDAGIVEAVVTTEENKEEVAKAAALVPKVKEAADNEAAPAADNEAADKEAADKEAGEELTEEETAKLEALKEALTEQNIAVLKAAGYVDFVSFKDVTKENLEALDTIGPATAAKIMDILKG